MSIRIGMPSVGRLCFEASGLLISLPPGVFSQATAPHTLPLHCATRMLATPSATFQSPVGSAASAGVRLLINRALAKRNPGYAKVRAKVLGARVLGAKVFGARVLGHCNMV